MGRVYRATDTRLRRQVAIKVLPPELAADPDRLARLEREAQVLAQLEHPNVAAVYGLEEAYVLPVDSSGALVGEPRLVAGGVGDQGQVAPSPDGTLVAYSSTEAGDRAVYVVALESGDTGCA